MITNLFVQSLVSLISQEVNLTVKALTRCKCLEQYEGSAVKFKTRFRTHKSDVKTNIEKCESARLFNSKCYHDTNAFQYLKVQFTEVHCNNLGNIEDILWTGKSTGSPIYWP